MAGYIMGIIGTVIVTVAADLQTSVFWEGLVAAFALICTFLGAPVGGWLAVCVLGAVITQRLPEMTRHNLSKTRASDPTEAPLTKAAVAN